MAEVRCQMCGKNTPAEKDTCQFCQARLKPLISPASGDLFAGIGDKEEIPDWLSDLRGDDGQPLMDSGPETVESSWFGKDETSTPQSPNQASDDGDTPDWLARLGGGSSSAPSSPSSSNAFLLDKEEESLPGEEPASASDDWMSEWGRNAQDQFGAIDAEDASDDEQAEPVGDTPDWLSRLGESDVLGSALAAEASTAAFGEGETKFAWEQEAGEETQFGQDDQGDWISRSGGQEIGGQAEAVPGEIPDWLSAGLGQGSAFTSEESQAEAAAPGELPDWMSGWGAAAAEQDAAPAEEPPAEAAAPGEQPDWMSGWGSAAAEQDAAPAEEPPAEAAAPGELPDWMSGLGAAAAEQDAAPAEEAVAGEMPDWLSQFGQKSIQEGVGKVSPFDTEIPIEDASLGGGQGAPDWLSQFGGDLADDAAQPEQEIPSTPPAKAPFGDADLPDWLNELQGQGQVAPIEEPASQAPLGGFDQGSAFDKDGESADWMSGFTESEVQPPAAGSTPAFVLDEEETSESAGAFVEQTPADYLGASPEWLSHVSEDDAGAGSAEGEPLAGLEQADLPEWLEAMRPVATGTPLGTFRDTTDDRVENVGPLAGLRGVLPAETGVAVVGKPSVYSTKMQVGANEQARLEWLQQLLKAEQKAVPLPSQASLSPQSILRLLILGVFLLAAIWALWAGASTPLSKGDASAPVGIVDIHDRVSSLPSGSAVLLAVDYEPAFAGEMESIGIAILDHLASQGVRVIMISTTPNGPALGERLVNSLNTRSGYQQRPFENYTNLGYIPGGSAGVLGFIQDPAQVMRYDLNGENAWDGQVLNAEKGIESFAIMLVMSEKQETIRSWVEQAGPALQTQAIPLLMLVSAQAEPLVRPYYAAEPQQVNGLAAGLVGGAWYESLQGKPDSASQMLDAYSIVILVAVIMILVGSLVSAFSTTLVRGQSSKGEKKA